MDNSFLVELLSFHQIMAKYKNGSLRDLSFRLLNGWGNSSQEASTLLDLLTPTTLQPHPSPRLGFSLVLEHTDLSLHSRVSANTSRCAAIQMFQIASGSILTVLLKCAIRKQFNRLDPPSTYKKKLNYHIRVYCRDFYKKSKMLSTSLWSLLCSGHTGMADATSASRHAGACKITGKASSQ